jgi:hypothetical protein
MFSIGNKKGRRGDLLEFGVSAVKLVFISFGGGNAPSGFI